MDQWVLGEIRIILWGLPSEFSLPSAVVSYFCKVIQAYTYIYFSPWISNDSRPECKWHILFAVELAPPYVEH